MTEKISLKEAERKVFQTAFQDGLWDVLLGCFALQWSIAPLLSRYLGDLWSSAVFLPFWGLAFLVVWLVRRHVVRPRIGVVKFGRARRVRLMRSSLVMLAINVVALVLGLVAATRPDRLPGETMSLVIGLAFLALLSTAAYFLDFRRLYVYGLLTGVAPPLGNWLYEHAGASHHGWPITFGVIAGLMILTGLTLFVRFLRDNPPVEAQPLGDQHAA